MAIIQDIAVTITTVRKLTRQEMTQAIKRYARKHGHYASTVRAMTVLRQAAFAEYRQAKQV